MKKILFTLIILASFSAFAGGSIFGHHKSRSRNPNGVESIRGYVCGSLTCHDVKIKEGSCEGIENASMKYGVCTCDDGYVYDAANQKCLEEEAVSPSEATEEEFEEYMDYLHINLSSVSPLKSTSEYEKSDSYKDLVDILAEVKKIADKTKSLKDDLTEENKAELKALYKKWKEKNYPQRILNLLGLNGIIKISKDVKVSQNTSHNSFVNKLMGIKSAYAGIVGDTVSICTGQKCTEVSVCTLGMTLASYIPVPGLEKLECLQISSLVDKVISETAISLDWDIVITVNDYPNELYQQVREKLIDWTKSEVLDKYLPSGRRCCFSNEIKNEKGTCQKCPKGQVSLNDNKCCSGIAKNDTEGEVCCSEDEEVSEYDGGDWYLGWYNSQSKCCKKGWYATRLSSSAQASCCEKGTTLIHDTIEKCCPNDQIAEANGNKKCCSSSQVVLKSKNGDGFCCSSESVAVKTNGTCCSPQDINCICEVDPQQPVCKDCREPKPTGFCEYVCNSYSDSVYKWEKVDPACCDSDDECSGGYYCDKTDHLCQPCPTVKENCNIKKDITDEHGCVTEKPLTCPATKVCAESGECECPKGGQSSAVNPDMCCKNKLLWANNIQDYTINSPMCSECPEDPDTSEPGVMSDDGMYCCKPDTEDGWSYSRVTNEYDIATPICGNCPTLNGIAGHPSKTNQLCCGTNNRVADRTEAGYALVSIKDCDCPDGGKYAPDGKTCCHSDKVWDSNTQSYKKEDLSKCRCESGKNYYNGHCCKPDDLVCICDADPTNEKCVCSGDDCCKGMTKPSECHECQKKNDNYTWVEKTNCCFTTSDCQNSSSSYGCYICVKETGKKTGSCTYVSTSSSQECCESKNYSWCGNECATDGKVCCSNGNAVSLSTKTDDQGGSISYVYSGECCSGNPPSEKNYCSYCVRDSSGNWSWQRFNSYKNSPESWNEQCLCDSEKPTCNFYSGIASDGFPSSTYNSSDPYKCNGSGSWILKNDYKTCSGGYCTYSDTCCPDPNPIRFHNEASGNNCHKCENGTWKLDDSRYKISGGACIYKYECGQNSDCNEGEVCYKDEFRCVDICSDENNYNGYSPSECICRRDGGQWCGDECAYEGAVCCNDGSASSSCCYNDYDELPYNCYECVNHQLVPKGGNFKYCPVGKQCTDGCCNFNLWQNGSCNVDATATCMGTAPSCGDSHYFSCLGNHQIRHTVRHSHMEGSTCKASDPAETDAGTVPDGSVAIPSVSNYLKS